MAEARAQTMGTAEVMALIRANAGKGFSGAARGPVDGSFRAVRMEALARIEPAVVEEDAPIEAEIVAEPEIVPPSPEEILAEARAAAFAEGHAAGLTKGLNEGRAQGLAEAEAGVVAARDAFVALVARLGVTGAEGGAELSAALTAAVRDMASARAGQVIDALPAPFVRRIEALADRVAQGVRAVTVALHPDDLAAITPYLPGSELNGATVAADARLHRGDVVVRAEGIVLSDLIGGAA
ncbi:FliH/SctL family protein [Paragemmobacter straminiformis]|uniref:Flagellar assembly protein FliH n=1 Tax=Paragemmobacter straminiformis TaxID=2045119 RepID=A0A842I591_9RHOB|nr:FliH/SctL family protein [Gemmobacter straminiformis]MBC2834779.1 flagellar assembly protein FliH [Gemmobacter straminiformis]